MPSTAHAPTSSNGVPALEPAPAEPVIRNPFTGDYRVDALLPGLENRWNRGEPLGTAVEVSFSFMAAKPAYGGTDVEGHGHGFRPLTEMQRDAARQVFARLQSETGLRFREVDEAGGGHGQIRLGNNTQEGSAGYAIVPFHEALEPHELELGGDIWLNDAAPESLVRLGPGSMALSTLVHEIGHALGLNHPGNYNGTDTDEGSGNWLGVKEDNGAYTVMSYRDVPDGTQRDWFGIYDLLALHALYGRGTAHAGDTIHSVDESNGRSLGLIYDAGGIDTLNAAAATGATRIDLRPGGFSSVGHQAGRASVDNVSIDLSTTIENFLGGAADDAVTGNDAANHFVLGGGRNSVQGGAGIDTVAYGQVAAAYTLVANAGTIRVAGRGVEDSLEGIERLVFSDRKLAFGADAELAAGLLGAVFGPASVADAVLAGRGLALLDAGMGGAELAELAVQTRLAQSGASGDAAVVRLLYGNVFGHAPGAPEAEYFGGLLATGAHTPGSLALLAAGSSLLESRIDLVGLQVHGLAFA